MKYLVDANVLSKPTRPSPNFAVLDWLRKNEQVLAVNPTHASPRQLRDLHIDVKAAVKKEA